MKASLWAEIRRLHEVEQLSQRAIASRLRCSHKTVRKALAIEQPPSQVARQPRASKLDRFKPRSSAVQDGRRFSTPSFSNCVGTSICSRSLVRLGTRNQKVWWRRTSAT